MVEEPTGYYDGDPEQGIWQLLAPTSFLCNGGCGRGVPHPAMLCDECKSQVGAGHHPGGRALPWEGRSEEGTHSYTARPCQPVQGGADDEEHVDAILAPVLSISLGEMIKVVAARCNVTVAVLATPAKSGTIAQARRLACYIGVEMMRLPVAELAPSLCLKPHTIGAICREAHKSGTSEQAWQIAREEGWLGNR